MPLGATAVYTPSGDGGQATIRQIVAALLGAADIAGYTVLAEAQMIVPVDTGEMEESGEVTVKDTGTQVVATVAFTADHSIYVELGTGIRGAASPGAGPYPYNPNWPGMPAQPSLRPALDTSGGEIMSAFQDLFTGISGAVPGEPGHVSID